MCAVHARPCLAGHVNPYADPCLW